MASIAEKQDITKQDLKLKRDILKDDVESWDTFYDDEAEKLILVSSNKVGFKVNARSFAKKSSFVREILEVPSDQEFATIYLDHTDTVVQYFIDLVLMRSDTHLAVESGIDLYHGLLQLCDLFDSIGVIKPILQTLLCQITGPKYTPSLNSWEVFKIAAKYDDAALAVEAIKKFERNGLSHRQIFVDRCGDFVLGDIPRKYAIALQQSAFRVTMERSSTFTTFVVVWAPNDFPAMALAFQSQFR